MTYGDPENVIISARRTGFNAYTILFLDQLICRIYEDGAPRLNPWVH